MLEVLCPFGPAMLFTDSNFRITAGCFLGGRLLSGGGEWGMLTLPSSSFRPLISILMGVKARPTLRLSDELLWRGAYDEQLDIEITWFGLLLWARLSACSSV